MSLLKLLMKMMLSSNSTNALSQNTGVSTDLLKKLLPLALPLLLKAMTSNASSNDGALSLLNAVGQHKTDRDMADQLKEADAEDGSKIIGHILGANKDAEILSLAQQTGLSNDQVSSVLSNIAPSLLSGMSGVLANGLPEAEEKPEKPSLFSALFGKKEEPEEAKEEASDLSMDGTDLLSMLLSLNK